MAESVKNKFFTGIAWSFAQNFVAKGIGFVFAILLARILMPEDYGLIGMLSIFIAVSDVFIQSGFGQALVQKADCTDEDFSTAFYFNLGISIFLYLVLYFSAPLIARFYHEPQLVALTRVLSLNFVLGSLNIVQRSKLSKAMNFKPLAVVTILGTLIGGGIGVIMAYNGFGVWSLVAQTLCTTIVYVLTFPFYTKWRPNARFSFDSFLHLWKFGSNILITGIIDVVGRNISNIMIGRFYNKEHVGYYSKSLELSDMPANTVSSVLGTVAFPMFSQIQNDRDRISVIYKRLFINTIIYSFPIFISIIVVAKPLVVLLLTEKWLPCVPLLQVLLLSRIFLPLCYLNSSFLQGVGEANLFMKLCIIAGVISLLAIIASIPFGIIAIAWGTFISGLLYYLVFTIVVTRRLGYSLLSLLFGCKKVFLSLLIMYCGGALSILLINNSWLQIIVGVSVSFGLYSFCCFVFNLVDSDVIEWLKSMISKYKN